LGLWANHIEVVIAIDLQPPDERQPALRCPALESDVLAREGFQHGFFMRRGGVSPSPWSSLNFAANTGDSFDNVRANLAIAGAALHADPEKIFFLSQVHGTVTHVLHGDEDRTEMVLHQGDATLSSAPGVVCGVRSADCASVLLADLKSGAVAAVHAGWRGTVLGVVEAAIAAMRAHTDAPEIVAAIGPHIEVCCFEVGDEVATELAACSSLGRRAVRGRSESKSLGRFPGDARKPHVDLRAILEEKLLSEGIVRSRIDHVRGCTVCDAEAFFSYRREGQVSGRMLSAIAVRTETL
jgi:polyphenol oxidase